MMHARFSIISRCKDIFRPWFDPLRSPCNIYRERLILCALRLAESFSIIWGRRAKLLPILPDEIAVVTGYTQQIECYAGPIARENARYARRHGYAFRLHRDGDFDPRRPASWSKILFVQQALKHHRWVLWCDADAIIMNHRLRLEPLLNPEHDLIFARWNGPDPAPHANCGVFLAQRSLFSRTFLSGVWQMTHFIHHYWWEQAAVLRLLECLKCGRIALHTRYRDFNAFVGVANDPDPYQHGDFIAHLSGYRTTRERTEVALNMLSSILR